MRASVFFWLSMSSPNDSTVEDLETAILNDATEGIASVSADGMSVNAMPLDDRLKIADRQKNDTAASLDWFGMRHRQLRSGAGGFP